MTNDPRPSSAGRRTVVTGGLAAAASVMLPAGMTRAQTAEIPRDKTMVLIGINARDGRWVDYELWNPYALGSNHQNGINLIYEPLAYYSAFADKMYMWLAESYQYAPDFKQLTIKTRSGIKWSDGTPFSAEDVAYTFNTLRDLGPKAKWGVDVNQALQEAKATDANTVVLNFKIPSPRFFFFCTYKYDIGVPHRAEAHLLGPGLVELQAFRHRQGLAGDDRPMARVRRLVAAESVRATRQLVGGGAEAGADAADPPQHLAALRGGAAVGAGHDHQSG